MLIIINNHTNNFLLFIYESNFLLSILFIYESIFLFTGSRTFHFHFLIQNHLNQVVVILAFVAVFGK